VAETYLERMDGYAGQICRQLRRAGRADLARLAFDMAVAVAADIVGLPVTTGLARRLDRFFGYTRSATPAGWRSPMAVWRFAAETATLAAFYLADVWPAVRSRRRLRRDDLISHLITEGATAVEILGECVTYAAAGMITTREFITVAAWHLLTDAELREQYVRGDRDERTAVLHEILRLEPVVSDLARWTTADHDLPGHRDGDHGPAVVPAGARVSISIAAANLDPLVVGADADRVCPRRALADGVAAAGLAFGDGAHRCPGMYVALRESEIFLSALLALPGLRLEAAPAQSVLPEISSYQLLGAIVAVDAEVMAGDVRVTCGV
jgi:cytochrome P450